MSDTTTNTTPEDDPHSAALPAESHLHDAPAIDPDKAPDKVAIASQWQLTWWAFKRHRLAVFALWIIGLLYLVSIF
ncbi:MAG: hypothetical protein KI788_00825, partial [Mameliella sp.]|nr:hypothetical protein [Mameliella sp.]